jgi:hypothetical protein
MTNEDKPAAPRRRFPRPVVWLVLIGALLAWHYWTRSALEPVAGPAEPGWPSPLDLLDPARLTNNDWPRAARPAEAVGVLELDRDADGRLEVSIDEGIVSIKDARGKEVVRIDAYAPPKRESGGVIRDPQTGQFIFLPLKLDFGPRDEHKVIVAALSPKADRLVVLGNTKHTPGLASYNDQNSSGDWAQVWRWEDGTLTPLEVQALEGPGVCAAAFSPDGKLLATSRDDGTDIWEVGDKALQHLDKISRKGNQLLFAPDSRSLAIINPDSFAQYDLGPLLPGGQGWAWWRFLSIALGLATAAAVFILVSQPNKVAQAQRRLRIAVDAAFLGIVACVAWWVWRPVPAGAPLTVGLGFGAALPVLFLLAWAHRHWLAVGAKQEFEVTKGILFATILGALVCLGVWGWQFWWPSLSVLTPSPSDLARADIKSACFSGDGRELAVVRSSGRLSLFDVTTGQETHAWDIPAGAKQPEFAPDGRHLLAVADGKAYVLRLKPFDDAAYVLSCIKKVLEQDPQATDALLARGHVHLHKGELDEAIADFTAVIALDEKSAAAYHGRGLARTDKGDYTGAKADFAAALHLDPKLAAAVPRRPLP